MRSGTGRRRSLKTKDTFQGENSHVLINRDCRWRICHKMNEKRQRALEALCCDAENRNIGQAVLDGTGRGRFLLETCTAK